MKAARFGILLTLLCVALAYSPRAVAYCASQSYKAFWSALIPDLQIPVYTVTGGKNGVEKSGLSSDEAELVVQAMVARHNASAAGVAPKLLYMGTQPSLNTTPANAGSLPLGLVVASYECGVDICGGGTELGCFKCSTDVNNPSRCTLYLLPEQCPSTPVNYQINDTQTDPIHMLLHEAGHALGLWHTNLNTNDCAALPGGYTKGNTGVTSGVMATVPSSFTAASRTWRRDDLEGLAFIYNNPVDYDLWYWDGDDPPNQPQVCDLIEFPPQSLTPPAISTATAQNSQQQIVGITDAAPGDLGRVLQYAGGLVGFATGTGPNAIVDTGSTGISFDHVAVAHSGGGAATSRVLVAWIANEAPDSYRVTVRWAMRDAGNLNWQYGTITPPEQQGGVPGTQLAKTVVAGFDQVSQFFVIGSITDQEHPYVVTIDLAGNEVTSSVLLDQLVYDLGTPACYEQPAGQGQCVVPYATSDLGGPLMGWFDGQIDGSGLFSVLDSTVASADAIGLVDLAADTTSAGSQGFRGIGHENRYDLDRLLGTGATNSPQDTTLTPFTALGWPLRVGSQTSNDATTNYRVFTRFPTASPPYACGNNAQECAEDCDGVDLGGQSCQLLMHDGGTLSCDANCVFDESQCTDCGNNNQEGNEDCDGTDLGGATCMSETGMPGTLACDANCNFDISGCMPACGNGVKEAGEDCDLNDFGGVTCSSFPQFNGGNLNCNADCTYDVGQCTSPTCGNGVLDPLEQCDASENPNSAGFCDSNCMWTTCADRGLPNAGRGTEGCGCSLAKELWDHPTNGFNQGDLCLGVSDSEIDLVCRYGPNHQGKRCMRCPYNNGSYGEGIGCPCGGGGSCDTWQPSEAGPDIAPLCTKNLDGALTCSGGAPVWITEDRQTDPVPRCWDAIDPVPGCQQSDCIEPGQVCINGECEHPECVDSNGVDGICKVMNMTCDPQRQNFDDEFGICININIGSCDVPRPEVHIGNCTPQNTTAVNRDPLLPGAPQPGAGVPMDDWCPRPYNPELVSQ